MNAFRYVLAAFVALPLAGFGQSQSTMNINTAMMEATCKIVGPNSTGSGFIVGTPDPADSKILFYTLVTAHHVLEGVQGDQVILILRKAVDRDQQQYQRVEVPIEIRNGGRPLWAKHPDVDLAAMFVRLPEGAAPSVIPATLLLTDERIREFELSPGTELLCLGYPFGAESTPLGFAILRSGKIASFPLLPTATTKSFLFDFRVFPGNSGGPVYLYQTTPVYGGNTHIGSIQGLLGVVTSERSITQRSEQLYEKRETTTPLGLGEVIHASFIMDLISRMPLPEQTKPKPNQAAEPTAPSGRGSP